LPAKSFKFQEIRNISCNAKGPCESKSLLTLVELYKKRNYRIQKFNKSKHGKIELIYTAKLREKMLFGGIKLNSGAGSCS